MNSMTINWFAD